ncbi:MAG: hypothetical protein Q9170_000939 [Blastenia crenularia]
MLTAAFRSYSCKRIDAECVPDYSSYHSLKCHTSTNQEDDIDALGFKNRDIVERATPTPRPMLSARIPPKAHEGKSDLDPTEWKPKLPHRPTLDASKYLGKFHRTPPISLSPRRPVLSHAMTMSSVPLTAPSLSATPSASSTSSSNDSAVGTPYNFTNRPLMHPNSTAVKSTDIVIPHMPPALSVPAKPTGQTKLAIRVAGPPIAATAAENVSLTNDLSYEKKWTLAHLHGRSPAGSLTTLLGATGLEQKAAM